MCIFTLANDNTPTEGEVKTLSFDHIKDDYFREKLEKGLIEYDPDLWEKAQLSPREEREIG